MSGNESKGMVCSKCGKRHTDWVKAGDRYLPGKDAGGELQPVECGRCGETDEVALP